MPNRVLLVDDVPELRSVLEQALQMRSGFQVVAQAGDGESAVAQAAEPQPDVMVLDLGLPDLAGHEVLTRVRSVSPGSLVVVCSGSHTPDRALVATSADVYAEKTQDVAYLVEVVADIARRVHRRALISLGPGARDVSTARHFVMERCEEWGCASIADDASIVVSELVANALVHVHVRTLCELAVVLRGNVFRIEVTDHGDGMPDPQNASPEDEHGCGLLLVSILCSAWGTEPHDAGKRVWAEMPARGPAGHERGHQPRGRVGGSRALGQRDEIPGVDYIAIA